MSGLAGKIKAKLPFFVIALICFVVFQNHGAKATENEDKIVVAAAADLNFVLKELASGFERETGTKVVISFGSTGMLAQQIESGAPFDAFFAADQKYVNELAGRGFILQEGIVNYAQGRLALVVNKSSGVTLAGIKDIVQSKVMHIAIANPDHAPYGRAAVEALKSAGVYEAVKVKLVFGENIRQALQFVQTGNAQAGIVALSIADVPEVSHSTIDATLHSPLNQGAGIVKASKNREKAGSFIKYVIGKNGRAVLEKYGFIVPEKN